MSTNHRVRAVLALPKSKTGLLLAIARAVCEGFQSNPAVLPLPNPPLATAQAQITALDLAQQATIARTKGTVATRDARRAVLVTSLESWRAYVQTLCDQSPEQAWALIAAAAMTVGKLAVHTKPVLAAKLGVASGSVTLEANAWLLIGRGVKKRAAYNWQVSADGGKTWVSAPATPLSTTTVEGLTPLVTYGFRVSVTVSKTVGAWSQSIAILVK